MLKDEGGSTVDGQAHEHARGADEAVSEAPAAHDPRVAHHFESAAHQFDANKLGMWLFIATEFLLFGGLFCAYAVFRSNHPALFTYGSQFLDTRWGAINTVVLITSSLTMAWAVRHAQLGHRVRLVTCLSLTVLGGAIFMAIKYVEYSHKFHDNLVWGTALYEEPHNSGSAEVTFQLSESVSNAVARADAVRGKALWNDTCRTCHGIRGEGIPGQGKNMRGSAFIADHSDAQLIAFIKVGRAPNDPLNSTGIQMPSKGGNLLLDNQDLADIVSYIRTFPTGMEDMDDSAQRDQGRAAWPAELGAEKSTIPPASAGPSGLVHEYFPGRAPPPKAAHIAPDPRLDPNRPPNLHLFFGIYFLMTGLHGLHVLIGMILITILAVRAAFGAFGPRYFTPVDLTGLYWHVVDIIWIFLFPLLYLIH